MGVPEGRTPGEHALAQGRLVRSDAALVAHGLLPGWGARCTLATSRLPRRRAGEKGRSVRARKAVVPAAGLGTRFLPATKAQPKEMLPLVDKPAIQYVIEEAAAAELDDVLLVTGRGKRALEDHFDHAVEMERQLA
ncbi:MAG: sugar phosphate nucleotidyltransferase, partial [Egibacteraceae bacterium]